MNVNVVGRGRIGTAVAEWLEASPDYGLQDVITRDCTDWRAAPLTIDAAGPGALRRWGERLLGEGDLWSVGAAALADPMLSAALEAAATPRGHTLRLFTGWAAGVSLVPRGTAGTLHIRQDAPGLGPEPGIVFAGQLADAALRFPDHLNTATAAALAGPGIASTTIELRSSEAGGVHRMTTEFRTAINTVRAETDFPPDPPVHPVAAALIAALESRRAWLVYG